MLKAFLQEAKWKHNKVTPTFEEYMNNGWISVSGLVILIHAFFLSTPHIRKEELELIETYGHDLLKSPSIIFRLCNDLGTSSVRTLLLLLRSLELVAVKGQSIQALQLPIERAR